MTNPLADAVDVLRRDGHAASARATALRRRLRTRPATRRRARTWAILVGALAVLLGGANAALAADGTGNPFLDAFSVKDSHGYTSSQYELSLGGGGGWSVSGMISGTAGFFLSIGWDFYRLLVAIVLWLYDFALQFKILDLLASPANIIATTLNSTIARLGLVALLLVLAFIVCVCWIQAGKAAAGIVEIFISLLIASLLGSTLANPVAMISGPNGAINTAKDLGVGLSAQIISGGSNTSSDPAALQRQTSAELADKFIRVPHQLINYGAVIDNDPKCIKVYDQTIADGPWGEDSHPRDAMGDCKEAYKKAAENPRQGLLGLATLSFGGMWLLLLVLGLVIILSLFVGAALFEASKFGVALVKGIVPGSSRQELFTGIAVMFICFLFIIATIAGIGAFTVGLTAVFANTRSYNPMQVFMIVDLFIILATVVLIRTWFSGRKAGRKLGERMQKSLSPGPTAVNTSGGPSAVTAIASKAGHYLGTKRALARSGLGAGYAPPGAMGSEGAGSAPSSYAPPGAEGSDGPVGRRTTPATKSSSAGRLAAMGAKGAWKATKIGLASTIGAPVYAPRAVGVVKQAATARKAALARTFADARAASANYVSGKAAQAGAFGQEYVHNVGAAAKAVGKYSGAAKVGRAVWGLGAVPPPMNGPAAPGGTPPPRPPRSSRHPGPSPEEPSSGRNGDVRMSGVHVNGVLNNGNYHGNTAVRVGPRPPQERPSPTDTRPTYRGVWNAGTMRGATRVTVDGDDVDVESPGDPG